MMSAAARVNFFDSRPVPPYFVRMNIYDQNFRASEANVRYLDADFVVLRPGTFVRCALTGAPIPIEDLTYWNVDRQEAYASPSVAMDAFLADQKARAPKNEIG
jgi:hypothetical protein